MIHRIQCHAVALPGKRVTSQQLLILRNARCGFADHAKGMQLTPLELYDQRCERGILRQDEHQRSIITRTIARLHDELQHHTFPDVRPPSIADHQKTTQGFFSRLFSKKKEEPLELETDLRTLKGLYLYGDVGCGKTMLMDLFYETLPEKIVRKQRIHFHAFMLNVHKRAHALKSSQGNSFDAIPYIAADIAAHSSVLCFDGKDLAVCQI